MDNVALILGSSNDAIDFIIKNLYKSIDSSHIVGFTSIADFNEAHLRNEFYDKIILVNKALSDDVESDFNQIHNLMSIKSPNAKIESVDLVYLVFSDTPMANISTFNKIFTEQNTAVLRSEDASTGNIHMNIFESACKMAPSDIIATNPADNHKIVGISQPTSADALSVGYQMDDHSETGWLDEDSLPPDDNDDDDDSNDDLPEDSDPDVPDGDKETTTIPPVPLSEDDIETLKAIVKQSPSTPISVPSMDGVFLVSSLNDNDVQYPVLKMASMAVLNQKKVLIVDLTLNHTVLMTFRDEPDFASYEKGIGNEPYKSHGISCVSLDDTLSSDEMNVGLKQDFPGYSTIFYVLDIVNIKYFSYSKHHGVTICISLKSDEQKRLITLFAGGKVASNAFAKAYEANGHLSFIDGNVVAPPDYFVDRVDWFKS